MSIREPSITPSQASVRTAARPLAPGREPSGQRELCLPRSFGASHLHQRRAIRDRAGLPKGGKDRQSAALTIRSGGRTV
jgi:hypothetical protein